MYAVIRTGGKQYRVKPGDVLEIEHISAKDPNLSFKPILVSTDDGRTLHGREAAEYTVAATMLGDAKGDKVVVFKYKNKTGYMNRTGHRQLYSLIEIASIASSSVQPASPAQPEPEPVAQPEAETPAEPEPTVEAASGA